ncbi:MAG: alanine racemase [Peptococcaceae bacterium]|nr:alanine racemase [Peptococcaceae bacterium]
MPDLPVWAEIDLAALAHNVREISRISGSETELMAVVKANAYGHGAVEVSENVLANGASRLAVARLSEGVELRRAGINVPILILGYTPVEQIEEAVKYGLEQTVYGVDYGKTLNQRLAQLGLFLQVHIKVDTGMGRIGIVADEESSAIQEIKTIYSLPCFRITGIFTHFASADSYDKSYTNSQWRAFSTLMERLSLEGMEFSYRHAANSAAIIDFPETKLNIVRAGIILYGLYPSQEVSKERILLKPVMSFKSRIAYLKEVPADFSVSYGCTYKTETPALIATIPTGYADGYSRSLSNRAEVLIRGYRAPVVGRVCMDQFMVDVSNIPNVEAGDEVVLFGRQGKANLPVEEIADLIGTINYEVVCMVAARVPRIYLNGNK